MIDELYHPEPDCTITPMIFDRRTSLTNGWLTSTDAVETPLTRQEDSICEDFPFKSEITPEKAKRRCSLGISLSDIYDLTCDSRRTVNKRCSLDLIMGGGLTAPAGDNMGSFNRLSSLLSSGSLGRKSVSGEVNKMNAEWSSAQDYHRLSGNELIRKVEEKASLLLGPCRRYLAKKNNDFDAQQADRIYHEETDRPDSSGAAHIDTDRGGVDDVPGVQRCSSTSTFASAASSACSSTQNHTVENSSPLNPNSPYYSVKFANSYENKLHGLIQCMNDSEQSRLRVNKIKILMKRATTKNTRSHHSIENTSLIRSNKKQISYAAIKSARSNQKRINLAQRSVSAFKPFTTCHEQKKHTMPRRVSRRRSSLAMQSYAMQFFPDSF